MTTALERDPGLGWFGLAVAAGGFFVGLVGSIVTTAVAAAVTGASVDTPTLLTAAASSAGLWIGFLLVPVLAGSRRGGVVAFLGLRLRPLVDVPLGLVAGLASTLVTGWVSTFVLDRTQRGELERKAGEIIDRAQRPGPVVVLVVMLCVLTPLAEEVFFRGLVFRSLGRVAPIGVAVVLDAALFGLVHYSGGSTTVVLSQLGLLAGFGAVLCLLTWRTGRLGAAVMAHATFNLVTVVAQLVQR